MKNSSFKNNQASTGGVLFDSGQNAVEIDNCVFTNNKVTGNGGAIYSINNIVITNSKFNGNEANYGNVIYSTNKLKIASSSFLNNRARIGFQMNLIGNVIGRGSTHVRVVLVGHNNVIYNVVSYPIYHSGSNGLVNINGKGISKSTALKGYTFKVNNICKTNSKSEATLRFNTGPNYDWKKYTFTALFGGNSLYKSSQTSLSVNGKIFEKKIQFAKLIIHRLKNN